MYNKLFGKIVKSSIWMEDTTTRVVWLTLLAVMDEDGFADLASAGNVAHTARVPVEDAARALEILSAPDPDSSDPDNEGRRIERVPGGWMILNSAKYRDLATRLHYKEQNRVRVARHRAKCNGVVTEESPIANVHVTPSDTHSDTVKIRAESDEFAQFWKAYPKKKSKGRAKDAWKKYKCHLILDKILTSLSEQKRSHDWTKDAGKWIPNPATWLNDEGWDNEVSKPKYL